MRQTRAVTLERTVTVRLLGPVQLLGADGAVVDLPSSSQRRLLAVLALHAPHTVRSGWLCEVLDVTPGALRTSVARLRRVVGADALRTAAGGYRLGVDVDAAVVQEEILRADGDRDVLAGALEWWAGPTLEEFRDESWAVGDVRRLDELRAGAVEDLAEIRLVCGDADRAIRDLEAHVAEHPYRDRPRGLLMRALAGSGRRTEALRVFHDYRAFLGDAVGTEPSAELRGIEERIVAGWRGIDGPGTATSDGSDPPGPARVRNAAELDDALRGAAAGVGRRAALERLTAAADRAVDQGVGVVLVTGEVGIGKTTLIAEFARTHAEARGRDVYYGRCDELAGAPFAPFPSIVGRIVDELPDVELAAHAARHGGDLVRLLPATAPRIGAPPAATSDERTARHLLFDAVADVVARAAAGKPMVLAIDDLQWAEPAAGHLLRHLVRNLGRMPVLVVVVVRGTGEELPVHVRDALADLARGRLDRIELEGLDRDDLADLVHDRVGVTVDRDVSAVADALLAETAGNPLLADHLLAHWERTGRIEIVAGVVQLSPPADLDVPATLRDLVWYRVSTLGPGAEETLTAAAVLGLEFNERVLAAMLAVDSAALTSLLDRAVAAGVVADHPSLAGTVRFAHALVARTLESGLGRRARRDLHARAFAAMLATLPTSDLAARLAHHARAGELVEDALHWSIEAGDRALADLAPDEGIRWYESAIADAETLGRPDTVRADLLVRLGEARSLAGDPSALDVLRQGSRLAQRCGARDVMVRAALATDPGTIPIDQSAHDRLAIVEPALEASAGADPATRAVLAALVAKALLTTDQRERRRRLAHDALILARSCDDDAVFATVAAHVMNALWEPGNGPTRAALAREAAEAIEGLDDPNLSFVVHLAAFFAAVCAGDAGDAARFVAALHAVADDVRVPEMRWAIGVVDAFNATMAGEFADAERIVAETADIGVRLALHEAIPVFVSQGFVLGTFMGRHAELLPVIEQGMDTSDVVEPTLRIGHAIVCCEIGRPQVAIDLLRDAMDSDTGPGVSDMLGTTNLLGYAVLALELEDRAAAEWLYPKVVPLAGEVSFNGVTSQGPIAAYAGKLASLLGHTDDAEHFLRDALATADAFGWQYHRATTLVGLAQNRFRANGHLDEESFGWLTEAGGLCARHGIAGWAARVDALRSLALA